MGPILQKQQSTGSKRLFEKKRNKTNQINDCSKHTKKNGEKKTTKAAGEDTTCGRPLCNSERTVGSLSFRFRPEVETSGVVQQQVKALGRRITVITRLIIDLTRWLLFVLCPCSTGPECVCLFHLFNVDLHGFFPDFSNNYFHESIC